MELVFVSFLKLVLDSALGVRGVEREGQKI